MKTPRFKVGDNVKVLRASITAEEFLWGDCWCSLMDKNIGKVLIVDRLQNWDNNYEYYKYSLDGCWYPEFVLQDATVNKQLEFAFMKQ